MCKTSCDSVPRRVSAIETDHIGDLRGTRRCILPIQLSKITSAEPGVVVYCQCDTASPAQVPSIISPDCGDSPENLELLLHELLLLGK